MLPAPPPRPCPHGPRQLALPLPRAPVRILPAEETPSLPPERAWATLSPAQQEEIRHTLMALLMEVTYESEHL